VPADIRATIDTAALQPGGATAALLGLPDGTRIGDWVNPQAVGAEHAMGFMRVLPSTWRVEAAVAPVARATPTARWTRWWWPGRTCAPGHLSARTAVARSTTWRNPRGPTTAAGSSPPAAATVPCVWDAAGEHRATLIPLLDGWTCITPLGGYKLGGRPGSGPGSARFEPGELDNLTLLQAAKGQTKVIVTSPTQHFMRPRKAAVYSAADYELSVQ
jgi:hypothetical protein